VGRSFSRRALLKAAGAVSIVTGLGTLAAACAPSAPAPAATPAAPASTAATAPRATAAKRAAQQVLTVRQYDEPGGFDPATLFRIETENVAFNVYSGLTTFDPETGEPLPDLAESWQVSPDATTYTFKLVENATWHQEFGKVTARDVKYSYERVLDPKTGSPYRAELGNIASIETPTDFTVIIHLKKPDSNFLYQVGNYHQGQIVKQEAIEKYGDQYRRNPVGSGPFALKEWVANSHIILEGHPGYFKGAPPLTRIRMNLIKDVDAAATALSNGEVDVAMNVGVSNETLQRLMDDKRFTMHKSEDYAVNLWIMNPDYAPLADVRVRQAMAHAVDVDAIAAKLTPHTGKPHNSILPAFMPVYSQGLPSYPYNPAKAKELLAQAGYASGFSVTQILTSTGGVTPELLMRQAQLAEVGINLQFELMETAIWNKRRNSGDYQMTARLYPAVNPDMLLFGYLHPDNVVPKGLNGSKYNNVALTSELEAARAELNVAERKKHYAEVQRIAQAELPYIPVQSSTVWWAAKPWIKNLQVDKLAVVNYFPVYLEEH
jgi:peptide/nickel transport system substrate-binding protein